MYSELKKLNEDQLKKIVKDGLNKIGKTEWQIGKNYNIEVTEFNGVRCMSVCSSRLVKGESNQVYSINLDKMKPTFKFKDCEKLDIDTLKAINQLFNSDVNGYELIDLDQTYIKKTYGKLVFKFDDE